MCRFRYLLVKFTLSFVNDLKKIILILIIYIYNIPNPSTYDILFFPNSSFFKYIQASKPSIYEIKFFSKLNSSNNLH